MLHNTGPYGPNETPVNMAAPINMNPSNHMNMVGNINHLAKLGHGNPPTPSGPYGLGDYAVYHQQHFNMGPQMAPFSNNHYQHLGFQHGYQNHNNPDSLSEGGFQNGMLPMNLNVHNDPNPNTSDYSYDKRLIDSVRPEIVKEQNVRKVPLNIPHVPNRSLGKPQIFNNEYVKKDSFHNPDNNLDLSTKGHERLPLNTLRRKKIENTVKLIENILINSANLPKDTISNDTYNNQSVNHENVIVNTTSSTTSTTRSSKTVTESDNTPSDPLSLTVEDTQRNPKKQRESIIKSPITNHKSTDSEELEEEDAPSDVEDVKPVGLILEIEPHEEPNDSNKTIEIKIENSSWTDSDYLQPFFRDSHTINREDALDYRIVDCDNSVSEASNALKQGIKPDECYECPHCCVLIKDPKRFLIHTKWHTFGLTVEKRTEMLREREEKKTQRRQAKIMERLTSKEVTDDQNVTGKTWPCKDCDKVFIAKGSLKNHRQRTHPAHTRECKICHKSLNGWIALRNHMATHAGEAGVGFQCSECPKRFKYSHSLAKHSDTHLEKTHACQDCPKKFGSQALLKMHMKTHERQSRGAMYSCTYCAKGFFEAYSLQVHERTHRNERPYLCEICNTSFGTNSSLKRHLKVSHSTSKPFECSTCHRSFSTETIRDRHEMRIHAKPEDFKFPCNQCDCKYLKSKDLQKHIYKVHPKNKRRKKVKSDTEQIDTE